MSHRHKVKPVRALLIVISLLITPTNGMADVLSPNITHLIAVADDLYSRGSKIVAKAPRTEGAADALAIQVRTDFGPHERAFQDAISALPATGELQSARAQATVRLGQFDNFVFNAVSETLGTCNVSSAEVDLRIARQILGELHRIATGHGRFDWNPPSLNDATNANAHCS